MDRVFCGKDWAELALISRAAVYKLRHGDGNNVGINTIYNIAKALGVRPCWLAYGEGLAAASPRSRAHEKNSKSKGLGTLQAR